MKIWKIIPTLVLLALIGCRAGSGNPILGKWTAKDKNAPLTPEDMEFTPTQQITTSGTYDVTYEIKDNVVTIHPGRNPKEVCTVNGDSMVCQVVIGGYAMVRVK